MKNISLNLALGLGCEVHVAAVELHLDYFVMKQGGGAFTQLCRGVPTRQGFIVKASGVWL
jgi:hypothetical protein